MVLVSVTVPVTVTTGPVTLAGPLEMVTVTVVADAGQLLLVVVVFVAAEELVVELADEVVVAVRTVEVELREDIQVVEPVVMEELYQVVVVEIGDAELLVVTVAFEDAVMLLVLLVQVEVAFAEVDVVKELVRVLLETKLVLVVVVEAAELVTEWPAVVMSLLEVPNDLEWLLPLLLLWLWEPDGRRLCEDQVTEVVAGAPVIVLPDVVVMEPGLVEELEITREVEPVEDDDEADEELPASVVMEPRELVRVEVDIVVELSVVDVVESIILPHLQLLVAAVVLKTTPTQDPALFPFAVSQRAAHNSGLSLVIQFPRKLLSAYVRSQTKSYLTHGLSGFSKLKFAYGHVLEEGADVVLVTEPETDIMLEEVAVVAGLSPSDVVQLVNGLEKVTES
ncbi:uncharacterized protein PV07_10473 [Cladophialophora immunda]|uniref:Uncharacterized protein n=1 Tax=Cladophialophora immunda TaxID=569365 RepID=A0A0D2C2Q3_9EURO|nr:uncharacterized protein PV07_10473 [Cladophialophora immunda]KIW24780.1 hypothetical protein PV07_10473 [Cladophialophora immunda]